MNFMNFMLNESSCHHAEHSSSFAMLFCIYHQPHPHPAMLNILL